MSEDSETRGLIAKWWHGETKAYDIPGVFGIHTERHWTSEWAHTAADFYLAHWQWVWGTVIAIVALWIAFASM